MSGSFKQNYQKYIFIYIFLSMFHLIINEDSKNDETLIASYNGKQWDFTLNMTNEFAQKFYEILKENKTIILPMSPLDSNKELICRIFIY